MVLDLLNRQWLSNNFCILQLAINMLHKHLSESLYKDCTTLFRNKHISQLRMYKFDSPDSRRKVNETESTLVNSIVKYIARIRAYYQ